MEIDNSRGAAFRKCPDYYKEKYINKLEVNSRYLTESRDFGHRVHTLLEERLLTLKGVAYEPDQPLDNAELENEALAMYAGYEAHYPVEPFSVVDVERVFKVAVPGTHHIYTGKFDAIVRYNEHEPLYTGQLAILEHKTEKRGAKTNMPQAWAARAQATLYKWAAEQLYGESIAHILLDVLTRQSPKGREPATFRRDILERRAEQCEEAISDLVYIADNIEAAMALYENGRWPQNTDQCCVGDWRCDFFEKHVVSSSPEFVNIKYKPAEEYLT